MVSAECHEVLLVIALKVRKLPAVEGLRHRILCGDSRPRRSAERSSAVLKCIRNFGAVGLGSWIKSLPNFDSGKLERKPRRASLARTAEGGCPHMVPLLGGV